MLVIVGNQRPRRALVLQIVVFDVVRLILNGRNVDVFSLLLLCLVRNALSFLVKMPGRLLARFRVLEGLIMAVIASTAPRNVPNLQSDPVGQFGNAQIVIESRTVKLRQRMFLDNRYLLNRLHVQLFVIFIVKSFWLDRLRGVVEHFEG